MPRHSAGHSNGRRNFLAACVTALSVALLHSSFDAVPAGEDTAARHSTESFDSQITLTEIAQPLPADEADGVPVPPDAGVAPLAESGSASSQQVVSRATASGSRLSSIETIQFCTLLLKDGARQMSELEDYTVTFRKQERINGDLMAPQTIDMKIQHQPYFAVYMRWVEGERGRQLLYSDAYEDGCMSIKFGGFKKILPALRVDPNCSQAKAESRYPITQAGVLNMINKIVKHREADLRRAAGVTCVRNANRTIDGRDCYCFTLEYASPHVHEMYRKHMIAIDTELHIPLEVRNFTWAGDADDLTPGEIDSNTLIEHYTFTNLNLASKLVAIDFSRDNPRYRM